jgi:uncharacterized protein (DUF433 family)
MIGEITLVDRGRGLQLSTSRITVMDLVQYFRSGWSHEEIMRCLPTLTSSEIAVVEDYYRAHKMELDAEDDRVVAYREEQTRLQAIRFPMPDETKEERIARFRKLIQQRKQEANGEGNLR